MRVGILRTPFDPNASFNQKMKMLGDNTGNMVFGHALDRLLKTKAIPYSAINSSFDFSVYDAIVITDLIWIRENSDFDYLNRVLDKVDIPVIPISVGLQANSTNSEFRINDSTLKILKRIEERAVIGVRGSYTANILHKHGVRNYVEIGCPSMYYWNNPELKIVNNVDMPKKILTNFRTFYGRLTQKEKHFLSYSANYKAKFIEQTKYIMQLENVNDERYFSYVSPWLENSKSMYFSIEDWLDNTSDFDFSIGGRFHGNVISLWNNTKSLFLYVDSRTKELTDHFNLPSMSINEFDKDKPIEYYYEKADYSLFNKNYKKRFSEFVDFLGKNGLKIADDISTLNFAKDSIEKKNLTTKRIEYNKKKELQEKMCEIDSDICDSFYNIYKKSYDKGKLDILREILMEQVREFKDCPQNFKEQLLLEKNIEQLKQWTKGAGNYSSFDEFQKRYL